LIVAGGANVPTNRWADNFRKVWSGSVFVLEKPTGSWRPGGELPRPLGYGVSITTRDGLICIGGSDARQHYADVFRLEWRAGKIITTAMPGLPKRCANFCGALIEDAIYVAGGIETPDGATALRSFWKLDLQAKNPQWVELDPWPGPERMLAVAGAYRGSFYLFSGTRLHPATDQKPVRDYLADAYRYTPGKGWTRLPDLAGAAAGAPSPAPVWGDSLLLISGDDGSKVSFKPLIEHPGFSREVLAFDVNKDSWSVAGGAPFSRATVPTVEWRGHLVVPNGEVRPRERTPEVWWADMGHAPNEYPKEDK
jgi:N-acetylneuraminic acid mutarotase